MDVWETAKQIAARYQIKVPTIRKWTQRGDLPHLRCGRLVRYNPQAVQEWIEQRGKNKE